MDLLDVNVLVNAYRRDAPRHREFFQYVESLLAGPEPFAVPAVVFSGFFRVVSHPRIFNPPSKFSDALVFAEQLRGQPHCLAVTPGERHWAIFIDLCKQGAAAGSLISDAFLAAMAIEIGAELITDDRGFGRWPRLHWRRPISE